MKVYLANRSLATKQFGHYRNYKKGVWKKYLIELLKKHKSSIDLLSNDLDSSHNASLHGGESVAYEKRKSQDDFNKSNKAISMVTLLVLCPNGVRTNPTGASLLVVYVGHKFTG